MPHEITKQQKSMFYVQLSQAGWRDQKEALVYSFSDGATTHVSNMNQRDFEALINYLKANSPCLKMKRKIYAILFSMNWIFEGDHTEWKINMAKIDSFLLRKGVVKKPFKDLNCQDEVARVLAQFEAMQRKMTNTVTKREVDDLYNELITELSIPPNTK